MSLPLIDQQITFLYTRDLEASAHFYGQVLELPLALDQGGCRIYATGPGAFIGICERQNAPSGPQDPGTRHVILTLVTQDVDGWHEALLARGMSFEQAPAYSERYRIYHAFLRDPSGYLIEIQSFLDPAWPRATVSRPRGKRSDP